MTKIDTFIQCIIKYGKIQNFIINNNTDNIDNLRKFHNYIKNKLIITALESTRAINFLDIACGKGGDLYKWLTDSKFNKLEYILAFDSHEESIYSSLKKNNTYDGAIARFQNIKKNYKRKMPFINFKKLNVLDKNILSEINKIDNNKTYNIVSCQFALHYFCEDDTMLNNVLNVVSKKLKKGGLFIGTATDGDLIKNILNHGPVDIPLLTIIKKN